MKKTSAAKPAVPAKAKPKAKPKKTAVARQDYTHITVILDRSGSMKSIRADTIGGFNTFLKEQQAAPGRATLTLVQFDSQDPYEVIHHFKPIDQVRELDEVTYVPRASTPLLDCLGQGIKDLESCLARLKESDRPEKILIVVVTDGQENASQKFSKSEITKMIEAKTTQEKWQFVFLSSDLAAIGDAHAVGIQQERTMSFEANAQGVNKIWARTSHEAARFRTSQDKDDVFSFDNAADMGNYLVVDTSVNANAISWLRALPDPIPDEYRTTKVVFRRIPAGSFLMGSPDREFGRQNDEVLHRVTLTQDFYIGVFPVTRKQWDLAMGTTLSGKSDGGRPVDKVSHNDLAAFLLRLSHRAHITIGLPTEAQWEYACRAGTSTSLNSGRKLSPAKPCPNLAALGRYAGSIPGGRTKTVGSYLPNAWGLYDMHGNVYEWCSDWYGPYNSPATSDPQGPATGTERVIRGGCWKSQAERCRSAARNHRPPDYRGTEGFRLAFIAPS